MDPELDEPITSLGFVHEWGVSAGVARVRLRLPTFFCAANFAWLMVSDARDAVLSVEGVTEAEVHLDDHFASNEINAGVQRNEGFVGAFAGEAEQELDGLRLAFRRKAYQAALERVCRRLRREGTAIEGLGDLVLEEVPASADLDRLLRRRADIGLPCGESSSLALDEQGRRVCPGDLPAWLRRAQTVRVNIEGNTELCRGLLRTRYHLDALEAELRARSHAGTVRL